MRNIKSSFIALVLCASFCAQAQVKLPQLIGNGMVLQRDVPIPIWGWARPGESVTLLFNNKSYQTIAAKDGKWTVSLPQMKAGGGSYTMKISASNEINLKDILIGEVWLCSGQSNMAFKVEDSGKLYNEEITNSEQQNVREFKVHTVYSFTPKNDVQSEGWKQANPENVRKFSSVAYFFAKAIAEKQKVPVGIINSSWGGTPIESWNADTGFEGFPDYLERIKRNKDPQHVEEIKRYESLKIAEWDKDLQTAESKLGYTHPKDFLSSAPDSSWKNVNMPLLFTEDGKKSLNGSIWLKKEILLPNVNPTTRAELKLGRFYENDTTYVNGQAVGFTSGKYKDRNYVIPNGVLKPGKNTIYIRIVNRESNFGMEKRNNPLSLIYGKDTIKLKGVWQYKPATVMKGMALDRKNFPNRQPGVIYNAMISPLVNYAFKGVLWYQGEDNVNRAEEYGKMLPAMITTWRKVWNKDFPFIIVQLPGYNKINQNPTESKWAEFREAQSKALALPNVGMSINYDLGEADNIHPIHKKEVSARLVPIAEELAYGATGRSVNSVYKKMLVRADTVWLEFDHRGSAFANKNGSKLQHFAIAGADRKFVWADAEIVGDKIKVWRVGLKNPAHVRYAWADNPKGANLYNKLGMPVASFRTDPPK